SRDNFVHKPNAPCFLGRKSFSRQGIATELAGTNGVGQLRDDDGGREAPTNLGNGELRVLGRDDDIASGDKAGAAADTEALDERDRGNRQAVEPINGLGGAA